MIQMGSARGERVAATGDAAGVLLAAAVAGGMLAQGGFYPRAQWYLGLLVGAAFLVSVAARSLPAAELRAAPVLAGAAFAGWALVDGAVHGAAGGGARYALLAVGLLAAMLTARRLTGPARELLVSTLLAVGVLLAGLGWLGVLLRRDGWAWLGDSLWRAASPLTYPNAAAAVLAVLGLLCLALLVAAPRSVPLGLAATALLAGLAGTLSRAGLLGLAVGAGLLAVLLGPRAVLRAAWPPVLGALVVLAGLLPSMPATGPAHPVVAALALAAGLAVGAGLPLLRPSRQAAVALVTVLLLGLAVAGSGAARSGVRLVGDTRATLDSPDRFGAFHAAWQSLPGHLVTGYGPGQVNLTWSPAGGGVSTFRYAHNEYLQVLVELGIVGLVLLLVLLAAVFRALYRAPDGPGAVPAGGLPAGEMPAGGLPAGALRAGVLAGCAALVVHAGLDFVWHLPAIPLLAAVLVGLAVPEGPARLSTDDRGSAE